MKYKIHNAEIELTQETSQDALILGRLSARLENGYGRVLRPRIRKEEGSIHILTCSLQDIVSLASE